MSSILKNVIRAIFGADIEPLTVHESIHSEYLNISGGGGQYINSGHKARIVHPDSASTFDKNVYVPANYPGGETFTIVLHNDYTGASRTFTLRGQGGETVDWGTKDVIVPASSFTLVTLVKITSVVWHTLTGILEV